jgi:glutaminyl-peptide cyclotransferase
VKGIAIFAGVPLLLAAAAGGLVVRTYPHDPGAFTQGLVFHNGFLYEGTGLNGQSSIRKVELATGKVLQRADLPGAYFGEGITLWKDKLIQITWRSNIGFVYDLATFKQIRTFTYMREGWGITHDGKRLIMSDGSSSLFFWDPETFRETGRLNVTDNGRPVENLNELEYVKGLIYANVWQTDRIAKISPLNGKVVGWIELAGLLTPAERERAEVMNGIAYDAAGGRLFITGKNWPKLFQIRIP